MGSDFKNSLVCIYITSSILIIGTNLFMMGVILNSPALRLVPRNALIVGICVADLLLGCFVTPMFTRTLMESKFPDCHTHLALQITGDHGVFFVVGWTLVLLNVLHVLRAGTIRQHGDRTSSTQAFHSTTSNRLTSNSTVSPQPRPHSLPRSPSYPAHAHNGYTFMNARDEGQTRSNLNNELPICLPCPAACRLYFPQWVKNFALTALPWVVSTITVVPLVLSNSTVHRVNILGDDRLLEDVMCMLRLPRAVLLTATLFSLYLPFYLCVAALVTLIFCHSRTRRHEHQFPYHTPLHPQQDIGTHPRTEQRELAQSDGLHDVSVDCSITGEDTDVALQPSMTRETQQPFSSSSTPLMESMPQDPNTIENLPIAEETMSRRTSLPGLNPQTGDYPSLVSPNSQSLLALCLPNAVYLLCYTPLLVHTWLHLSKVYTPDQAYGLVLFILLSRSFLMPLTWLSFSDIRQEASELWVFLTNFASFAQRGRTSMSSSSSVSFSRLQENQAMT